LLNSSDTTAYRLKAKGLDCLRAGREPWRRRSRERGGGHRRGLAGLTRKQKAPETFRSPGLMWEWAFATRSFPFTHAWALSLSRAVCFPTPLSAAGGVPVSWRDRPGRFQPESFE
jgi:hypothetical protein